MLQEAGGDMYKVLMVEDDRKLSAAVCKLLEKERITVDPVYDGNDGLDKILNGDYDLYLLDIMMPGLDGFELCKIIRKKEYKPVVFLTGKVREDDQLYGYELGADDYIVKPFSVKILYSKLLAILERTAATRPERKLIRSGRIEIDPVKLEVKVDGENADIQGKEFAILMYMLEHPETAIGREELFKACWGPGSKTTDRVVDNRIKNLRQKLGPEGGRIKTLFRVGYRFD